MKFCTFQGIVSPDLFYKAQGLIIARNRRYSNDELLERLKSLDQNRGTLSGFIISETDGMPSPAIYAHRFGSLIRAYQMVGYTPERDYHYIEVNRLLRRLHPQIVAETEKRIADLGGAVVRDPLTDLLQVNHEFTVSLVLARCHSHENGRNHWKVRFDTGLGPDITVAVRLDSANKAPLDYYLLPRIDFSQPRISLADQNPVELESYRFETLDYLYGMAERVKFRRTA